MRFLLAVVLCMSASFAQAANGAASVRVATASNFVVSLEALAKRFERASGHRVEIMAGSTGTLYAQITQGAPFDMFLAADAQRPALLEQAKLIVPGSRAPYARGQLTLWAPASALTAQMSAAQVGALLQANPSWRIAIANPQLAPYGKAAQQALTQLAIPQRQLVFGQNVGQAFALVRSGNAQAGFVASAQLFGQPAQPIWPVPAALYGPINQDMVILKRAAKNPAAKALHAYLLSEEAAAVLQATGYLPMQAP